MQNRPTAAELIGAVATFVEQDVMPNLEGGLNFRCRVASNALRIIERELDLAPELDAAELERLIALLGADGSLADMNLDLSERIRSGAIPIDDPKLLDHLKRTTLGKASIDNPKYSGYRDATKPEAGT